MNVRNRVAAFVVLSVLTGLVIAVFCVARIRAATDPRMPALFVQTSDDIDTLNYSADGKFLITTNKISGLVTFRDSTTGRIVRQWTGDSVRDWFVSPQNVWLSNDGGRMIVSSEEPGETPVCTLRDTGTGRAIRSWKGQVFQVCSDFSLMIIFDSRPSKSDAKGRVHYSQTDCRVVDVATGAVIGSLPSDASWRTHVSMLGHYVCVPQYNRPSLLLHLPDMNPVLPLPPLDDLTMSSDEKSIVGITGNGKLYSWFLPSGKEETISTGLTGTTWLKNVADGIGMSGYRQLEHGSQLVFQVRSPDGLSVRYTVDSFDVQGNRNRDELISCQDNQGPYVTFKVYDARTGRLRCTLDPTKNSLGQLQKFDDEYTMWRTAISPDGQRCAYATSSGLLELFDISGTYPHTVSSSAPRIEGHISADSAHIPNENTSKRPVLIPQKMEEGGMQYEVHSLQMSNDGHLAAVVWNGVKPAKSRSGFENVGEQLIDVRDVKTGKVLKTLLGRGLPGYQSGFWAGFVGKPSFSADNKYVAVALAYGEAGSKTVIWDTRSGSVTGQISFTCGLPRDSEGNYNIHLISTPASVAFSPDGRFLAVARDDGSIYLYSLKSFLPVAELCSPDEKNPSDSSELIFPVQNLVFGPNGKELYGSPDGTSAIVGYDVPTVND